MDASENLSAQIVVKNRRQWTNTHQNFSQPIDRLYDVANPQNADFLAGLKATIASLQALIDEAIRDGVRVRAIGSGWSFSKVTATEGRVINTKPLNWMAEISGDSIAAAYQGDRSSLLFVQCGTAIAEINRYLEVRQRSLKTSGASNGQTIAGAMSTGTHGSAFEIGAVQDYVVGIHLIVGPTRHVWLERASSPVVSDSFAQNLGAELIRDDTLFLSALVSFGSFGLIHGVMIETVPSFLLEAHRQRLPLDTTLKAVFDTLDFSGLPLPGGSERPYHFDVVANPHDLKDGIFVRSMYQRPAPDGYQPDYDQSGGLRPGDELLNVFGVVSDAIPDLIPSLINAISGTRLKEFSNKSGTLGEIFDNTSTRGKVAGVGIGVPVAQASHALDLLLSVHDADGPFAGVFALRFVKKSDAVLAFTRFDTTCVIDLDGTASRRSQAFFRRVWRAFEKAEIPFTLHWGKIHNLDAGQVRRMYGSAVDEWLASRHALLDAQSRRVFSNAFLERAGLAE